MTKILRYPDLVDRGVVRNRTQLGRLIKNHDFPSPISLGANSRGWFEDEVDAWLQSRRELAEAQS